MMERQLEIEIEEWNQRQNDDVVKQYNELLDWVKQYYGNIQNLVDRVEALEKMIAKVPEFYEYWKRLNACGYQD